MRLPYGLEGAFSAEQETRMPERWSSIHLATQPPFCATMDLP